MPGGFSTRFSPPNNQEIPPREAGGYPRFGNQPRGVYPCLPLFDRWISKPLQVLTARRQPGENPAMGYPSIPTEMKTIHRAIVDFLLAEPSATRKEVAAVFGRSEPWVRAVMDCDAFKNLLEERRREVVDPLLIETIEARRLRVAEKRETVAELALDRLSKKLENRASAMKDQDLISAAKLGLSEEAPKTQNNQYVFHVPPPAPDRATWLSRSARRAEIIDISQRNEDI